MEYFNPLPGQTVQIPNLALLGCSPLSSDGRAMCSVFWFYDLKVLEAVAALLASCCRRSAHPLDLPRPVDREDR